MRNEDKEVIDRTKKKQNDLPFLLYCAFIFDKRTKDGSASVDQHLADTKSWLSHQLRLDVEPFVPSVLNFNDADAPRLVEVFNTYLPQFPLNLEFSDNSVSHLAKRLTIQSPATYSYKLRQGILDLSFLHGGDVEIDGDVAFDTVVDLLFSHKELALTTDINVSGSLVGCDPDSVSVATRHLREYLYETDDENLFGFSICGGTPAVDVNYSIMLLVRKWKISFSRAGSDESRSCLCVEKVF